MKDSVSSIIVIPEAHARPCKKDKFSQAQQDDLSNLKTLVQTKNTALYKLQLQVLQLTYEETQQEGVLEDLTARCQAGEQEINVLCIKLKMARCSAEGKEGFEHWQQQQIEAAQRIKKRMASASPSEAAILANKASMLEQQTQSMVQELRANLARCDHQQFTHWRNVKKKELESLEAELIEARKSGCGVEEIIARLEACYSELERMVGEASSLDNGGGDSDTDSDLEYEELEELEVGDRVKLVGHDEDGFVQGDEGIVVEVALCDPFPYRIKSGGRAMAHGYFKACDLQLLRRHCNPPSQRHCTPPGSRASSRSTSPYENRCPSSPYENRCPSSPYTPSSSVIDVYDNVDLEKGLCRARGGHSAPPAFTDAIRCALMVATGHVSVEQTAEQAKSFALSLSPLAVC